jgi:uncharacterized protein YjbI with pentapeptide repeats
MAEDIKEEDGQRVVPASIMLAKIEKGELVEYDNVIIEGDLDISILDLPKQHIDRTNFEREYLELSEDLASVNSIIKIKNSQFQGAVKLRNIVFENEVSFTNCEFNKYVHFVGSRFKGLVNFDESRFNSFTDFTGTLITGLATYLGSIFNDRVDFVGSWSNHSMFVGTKFNKDALFMRSRFGTYSQFNGAEFRYADFMEVEFCDVIYFEKTKFFGITSFLGSKFNGMVEFNGSEFRDSVDFREVCFMGYTSFDNCIFDRVANFGSISLSAGSNLSLKYSSFEKILISWRSIKGKLIFDGSAYLALVKNYNNQGRFNDADECYYHYRIKRSTKLKGFNKILDFFVFYLYGYGIRPTYPLALMAVLFIFSILVYLLDGQARTPINAVELSLVALTAQIPNSLTGLCRWWSIAERILGWLLMSSFLVVLAKKTLR